MARSETKRFLPPEERMAALMRALGHPARIAILKLLAERGAMPCFELVEELPLAQATISQHLRTLREVGLITFQTDGPRSYYRIRPETLQELDRAFRFLMMQLRPALSPEPGFPPNVA
ncbi:regulatory protein ArsR [Rhodothermus marinus SG0.5JP17-172]|uniref:ArsR/SmtB family transcription factor n=1 Tax=Rhodothermus marinus TaxID=29549 RepID=UPI000223D88A|nr:metalloregulator ArsR/SmtB family transcription factor [Rhodothermus marinus]AEN72362.1 regulatory protein ArsR [Rhodothermus marinus SG0.5JP17-172]MBO2491721.1 ArsR family transcriptional regulator [Rhodothermus marinus]